MHGAIGKNIIMCLSPGRSGTQLLTRLMGIARDTVAVHEPEPTFRAVTEAVRESSDETLRFVRDIKLPDILARAAPNYVETSHLFGKGPFEAFVALGVPFRLIVLNRDPRPVAKSHWRIKAIPGRSRKKQQYLLHPQQDNVMRLRGWEKMTDYQLCYWYCLEMERRKENYSRICRACNIPVTQISLPELMDFARFGKLCGELGLDLSSTARTLHETLAIAKCNAKRRYLPKFTLKPLARQEAEVWSALGEEGARLYPDVAARYRWD